MRCDNDNRPEPSACLSGRRRRGEFQGAADRLGVTRSAVSQGVRRLEDICGIALVSRTTRSVRLTEAGNRFREALSQPMADVKSAFDEVAGDARPRGLLRIAVTSIAEQFLSGPLIASFAEAHPGVTLDVTVTDDMFDIVAAGFDAGVRLGEVIEQDMVAVPLTREEREVVVASPRYFELHGTPRHPRELVHHRCIGWRPSPSAAPYRWEFEQDGIAFDVAVEPQNYHKRSEPDDPHRARWRRYYICVGRDISVPILIAAS